MILTKKDLRVNSPGCINLDPVQENNFFYSPFLSGVFNIFPYPLRLDKHDPMVYECLSFLRNGRAPGAPGGLFPVSRWGF
jgi:hypothetical protein